jgi:hypothetical protein
MTFCSFGINGGEFPHWPVADICELGVKLRAQFVELSSRRIVGEGTEAVGREFTARRLGVHVNAGSSELATAFGTARALGASVIVVFDDAIERVDASRRRSLDDFHRPAGARANPPGDRELVHQDHAPAGGSAGDHPACRSRTGRRQLRCRQLLQRRHRALSLRLRAAEGPHRPAPRQGFGARYLPSVHGDTRRVLHRAGGNVVCLPLGTGAVNWAGLIARLKQDGYRGAVSLEPHTLPEEMAGIMEQDAAYLRAAGLVA